MKYLEILTQNQLYLVGTSFILGLIFGASYDIIRVVHILCGLVSYAGEKPVEKKGILPFAARFLLDFAWTASAGAAFSVFLYAANSGRFRWFAAASSAAGFALWHVSAGRCFVYLAEKTASLVRRFLRLTVVVPAAFLARLVVWAAAGAGRLAVRGLVLLWGRTCGRAAERLRRRRGLRRTERARLGLAKDIHFGEGEEERP